MDAGLRPLLGNGLGGHLADAHHGDPLVKYELDGASAALRTGKRASELIRRNRWVTGGLALAAVLIVTLFAVDFKDGSRETEIVPHYEDSGEDPYKEDVSWIKNTEKRFREEERLRDKQIELAKKEEHRYKRLRHRIRRLGNNRPLPAKKTFVIPPSAFPEFHPKPRKTEAEREAEREAAKREEERRQDEEEALRREVEAAEYKYLLEGRVEPPLSSVPNCVNCQEVDPPSECSKNAFTLASNVRDDVPFSLPLLASPHSSLPEPLDTAASDRDRRRKLSFALKPTASTDQVPFEEPTGIAKNMVGRLLINWKEDPGCAFWTRKCVRKSQREINVLPFDKGPEELFADHILPQSGDRLFPNLQEGDLGICAVVGSGANLKGTGRGTQIDSHETVFRFLDAPTEGYEEDVGNKTTVAVIKAGMSTKPEMLKRLRDTKDTVTHYHFERLRDWKNLAAEEDEEEFTFFGKELLWATELSEQATSKLYKMHLAGRSSHPSHIKHMPTSGFRLVTALIASRLCLRVDVYGVSAAGGGRYHAPGNYISRSHVLGLEQWLPRLAMQEEMGVCVYD